MNFKKNFETDILIIKELLAKKEKFAFSKFADGELEILLNNRIRNCDNWVFNPESNQDFRKMLIESLKYKDNGYKIGISCPCCHHSAYIWFLSEKGSIDENTTFANIFVNGNYDFFKKEILSEFNNYEKIILIANKNSNLNKVKEVLNFTKFYGIGDEAFKTDLDLINILKKEIELLNIKDALFLFCAGPLGNVLSHQLWDTNKNNTYIDIGSTLNIWTEKNIRDYQTNNGMYTKKICKF